MRGSCVLAAAVRAQVIRHMVKNHESFTIDNTKLRAREAQITSRFGEFVRAAEDRFAGEASDRYNVLTTFGEDLDSKVRAAAAAAATRQRAGVLCRAAAAQRASVLRRWL